MSSTFLFDLETTGLMANRTMALSRQPEVIEVYACLASLETGETKAEVASLIRPLGKLPERVTKITGITNDMVFAEGVPVLAKLIGGLIDMIHSSDLVISHNASFDTEVLEVEAERCGKRIIWPRVLCTVEQTISLRGYRLSLGELHEHCFGVKFTGAHRARDDVQALLRCCVHLRAEGVI
jgi:DNA polymerase III epsilon subunit-like protein